MRRPLCLLCLCYVFVVYVILRLFPPQSRTDIPPDGTYFTCSGEVTAIEIQNDKSILYLSVSGESNHNSSSFVSEESNHNSVLLGNDLHIICYFQDASLTSRLKPGNQVCITGICRHFQTAANDGQFDAKQHYEMLGLDFAMTNCTGSVSDDGFGMGAQLLYLMREKMSESFDCGLPPEDAGVMKAMLLGKKGDMDEEVKGLYQRNGISHILAISGLHITFLGMGAYRLCRKCRMPVLVCSLVSFFLILGFGKMTGSGASTVRSCVMFFIFLLAGVCGRTYDMLTAMAVSACALLVYRPQYVFYSGFLLSFGAVMGIALVSPLLSNIFSKESLSKRMTLSADRKEKWMKKIQKDIATSLKASLSVSIATLPLQLYFFYTASPYSCLLNLIVVPLAGVLMALGLAGGVATCFLPECGHLFLMPARVILNIYEILCRSFDCLPGGQLIIGQPSRVKILLYYVVLLMILFLSTRFAGDEQTRLLQCGRMKVRGISWRWLVLLLVNTVLLCFRIRGNTTCAMLDVGQGDGIVIEEKDGGTVLIDGGSSDISQVGKYRIVPYLKSHGVDRLDYIFVSHADEDHISGVREILSGGKSMGIRVNCLVLTKFAAEDVAYEELVSLAEEMHIRVLLVGTGDFITLGDTCFTCLYPKTDDSAEGNDQSMVLLMECNGIRTLFTGDLTEEKEKTGVWEDVDILKVGHHGSRYSSCEGFLQQCRPEVAVISAGEENRYGHPHQETMERLEQIDAKVFTTKESGAITIRYEKGNYAVSVHEK